MIYKNFDEHIMRKHGIVVEGWPLCIFDNPSAIGSQVELNILLRACQAGTTLFHRMTEDEHMAWVESHANSESLSIGGTGFPTTIPPPQAHIQDTCLTPLTNPPSF